jgi:hypothetical protein
MIQISPQGRPRHCCDSDQRGHGLADADQDAAGPLHAAALAQGFHELAATGPDCPWVATASGPGQPFAAPPLGRVLRRNGHGPGPGSSRCAPERDPLARHPPCLPRSGLPGARARASPRSHPSWRAADGRGGPAPWRFPRAYTCIGRGMRFGARGSGRLVTRTQPQRHHLHRTDSSIRPCIITRAST